MSVYRYKASSGGTISRGEIAADTASAARAALRSAGMSVLDVRPMRAARKDGTGRRALFMASVRAGWHAHLRRRRVMAKGDLFDALATMLASGLPLLEAVSACSTSAPRAARAMLLEFREALRGGASFSEAMAAHPDWFDAAEVAMANAGQHRGELPGVLNRLAQRHAHAGELAGRLIGALTYPFVVALVGVGVVVFLSTKTLPELVGILSQSQIETPRLTAAVMWFGQGVASWWWLIVCVVLVAPSAFLVVAKHIARQRGIEFDLTPRVVRRLLIARLCAELAEMVRTGVPAVEALRVLAPTFGGPFGSALKRRLEEAADRVERGDALDVAMDDPIWFDAQLRALLTAGQASGELDTMLDRMAERETRRARRLVDRLAALLEPTVILLLATMVGTVAMAGLLPLIRLQEAL